MGDLFPETGKPVIDRPLIAYAFLAQTSTTQGDLLSGLIPIFKPIAGEWAGRRFDPKEFSRRVEELYQISIHPWAVDDLAPRLEKAKLLTKMQETRHAISYNYAEIEQEFDEVGEADIRLVVQRFIDYARPLLEKHKLDLDEKQLEGAFFKQLTSMDFHAALLRPKRALSDTTIRLPAKQITPEHTGDQAAKTGLSILCAGFILAMHQSDQTLYDLMLRIATGAMVAEAVLNIQNPGGDVTFNRLKIFLDGPFLMALLDLDDESSTSYAKALCEQLRSKGASLQVFRHSIEEIQEALDATLRSFEDGQGRGALARRLGKLTYRRYVQSVARDLVGEAGRRDVAIVNVPTATDNFAFFSQADEGAMTEVLGHYENSLARERDAASIAAIMRLRRGRHVPMGQVHHAQCVFVTSNARVAMRADSFTVSRKMRAESEVPPVFTDRYMASLLFVMFGGQGKEMTHYQLLANCAAALEPDNNLMSSMHRFLTDLDPTKANHFRALMTDDRASQHMMQLTLGEVCITSTQDAAQLLEALEERYGEEARRRFDEQLAEERKANNETLAQQSKTYETTIQELLEKQRVQDETVAGLQRSSLQDRLDLDAANRRTQGLSDQVDQLLALQQQDTLQRLEDCARHGQRRGELRQRELSLGLAAILLVCTLAPSAIFSDEWKILLMASSVIVSAVSALAFWKNPDKLFGKHIARVRQLAYEQRARELHVDKNMSAFVADFEHGKVTPVEPATASKITS